MCDSLSPQEFRNLLEARAMQRRRATPRRAKSSGRRTQTRMRPTPACGLRAPPRATSTPFTPLLPGSISDLGYP